MLEEKFWSAVFVLSVIRKANSRSVKIAQKKKSGGKSVNILDSEE